MRSQRYAQRVAWAANAHQFGRRWRSYAGLAGGAALVVAVLAVWPYMPLREALIGFTVGATAATAALSIARFDDPQVRGDLAEQWSAQAFGRVRGWRIVNGLSFPDGDLDHVVVTPSGVLAVETKYRFQQTDRARLAKQRRGDLDAAKRAARKTASMLRSKNVGQAANVAPVLMVWGKGAPTLADGYVQIDGAYVLDGDAPELWSHLFNAPLVPNKTRDAIYEALSKFQQKQIAWADQSGTLRSLCWARFWSGVREARDDRQLRVAKRSSLRRRHTYRRTRPQVESTAGL